MMMRGCFACPTDLDEFTKRSQQKGQPTLTMTGSNTVVSRNGASTLTCSGASGQGWERAGVGSTTYLKSHLVAVFRHFHLIRKHT